MDFAKILKTVAPWIATAIAGPAGPLVSMAVDAAANALGIEDKTLDAVKAAVMGATHEELMKMKQADQDFALKMQELGYKSIADLETLAVADRKDARAMQILLKSNMPAALTIFVISSFIGTLVATLLIPIPVPNRDIVVYMIGQLSGFASSAMAFWLGTTRDSARKTELLAQSAAVNADASQAPAR
jgi:hypothetical protein